MISGGKLSPALLLKKTSLFSSRNTRWIECGSSLNWLVDASGLEVTLGVALFFPFRDSEDNMDDVLLCFLGYYWDGFPSIVLLDFVGIDFRQQSLWYLHRYTLQKYRVLKACFLSSG